MGKLVINFNLIILFVVNNFYNRVLFKKLIKYIKDWFMIKNIFVIMILDFVKRFSFVIIINVG